MIYYFSTYSVITRIFGVENVLRSAKDYDFDIGSGYTRGSQPVQSLTHKLWPTGWRKEREQKGSLEHKVSACFTALWVMKGTNCKYWADENSWKEISVVRRW